MKARGPRWRNVGMVGAYYGDEQPPSVLFLPGWGDNPEDIEQTYKTFRAEGIAAAGVVLRLDRDRDPPVIAREGLTAVISLLKCNQPILVGASIGGIFGLFGAAEIGKKVGNVGLVNPPIGTESWQSGNRLEEFRARLAGKTTVGPDDGIERTPSKGDIRVLTALLDSGEQIALTVGQVSSVGHKVLILSSATEIPFPAEDVMNDLVATGADPTVVNVSNNGLGGHATLSSEVGRGRLVSAAVLLGAPAIKVLA